MPTLPITSIVINRDTRQRRNLRDITSLAESIRRFGLINPPVLTEDNVLLAGERRITAALSLGWTEIEVRYFATLAPAEAQAVELEENLKRADLTWQEVSAAVAKYHALRLAADPTWTNTKTGEELGMSEATVRERLMVQTLVVANNKMVVEAPKFSTALGIARRIGERAKIAESERLHTQVMASPSPATNTTITDIGSGLARALQEDSPELSETVLDGLLDSLDAPGQIHNDSFLEWAPEYSGPKFNLIHCDFPYGVNADKFNQGSAALHGGYADDPDTYWRLLDCLCNNIDRIASESCHLIFWFSMDYYTDTLKRLATAFDRVDKRPLIWHKNDNRGILPDPNRGPRWSYETALFCSRGDRKIIRPVSNVAPFPITQGTHMSEKTQAMLEHFFKMVVDEHSSVLDPTCGSGSAIRAALACGASRALGLEIDPDFAERANERLAAWEGSKDVGGLF